MGWLGRLIGTEPPRIPAGGRAFTYMSVDGRQWSVRVQMPGEEQSARCKRLGPVFDTLPDADRYLTAVNGGPAFTYPPGAA